MKPSFKSHLAIPFCSIFLVLAGCNAADYTNAQKDTAKTATAKSLNVKSEVALLTKTCLTLLEAKSTGTPDLAQYGYFRSEGGLKKTGPRVSAGSILYGKTRESVSIKYYPTRTGKGKNRCSISVQGLEGIVSDHGLTRSERTVTATVIKAAKSIGFKGKEFRNRVGRKIEQLTKGSTVVTVSARYSISGIRVMEFSFSSDP